MRTEEEFVSQLIATTPCVRTSGRAMVYIVLVPILVGCLGRGSGLSNMQSLAVMLGLLGVLATLVMWFATAKLLISEKGIIVQRVIGPAVEYSWSEIDQFNCNSVFRYLTIRARGRRIYTNSTEGLLGYENLLVILGYKTEYRCPERLAEEIRQLLASVGDHASTTGEGNAG
ncbi:MAG: hypothetical protein C0404_12210 [Verrucomicrobia bacterium]|nr:hypothetical protein [Verrucomicrobiota bacterium]